LRAPEKKKSSIGPFCVRVELVRGRRSFPEQTIVFFGRKIVVEDMLEVRVQPTVENTVFHDGIGVSRVVDRHVLQSGGILGLGLFDL